MSLQIAQFNPEYRFNDRRQNSVAVGCERSTGLDRRQANKPFLGKLKNNIDRLDLKTKDNQQALLYALSPIPTARRIGSLPDSIEDKNWSRAGLLAGMAVANFPCDWTQVKLAGSEIKDIFSNGFKNISKNP